MVDRTEDGYDIIKPLETNRKGIQCGKCGMRFDDGKVYGYWCSRDGCPVQLKTR